MIVTFWGVRGTIPAPGEKTLRYGGNTTAVSVAVRDKVLVLDAGTGIRALGQALAGTDPDIFIAVSHRHTDHIVGFPYFKPLYEPKRPIHLLDYRINGASWSLLTLFDGVHFPLTPSDLVCAFPPVEGDQRAFLQGHGLDVEAVKVNHPGGAYGYRVTDAGRRFVFIPDNEIEAADPTTPYDEIVAFCRGADVLCHDAQYLDDDMPAKHGWGHSCLRHTCALAIDAGVRHLVFFHHDPDRTDDQLDAMQAGARRLLEPHGIACTAAYEGLCIKL